MAYVQKFLDSVITDAGRHILLDVDSGQGTLVYTRAVMTSQIVRQIDENGNLTQGSMSDEQIRAMTQLSDDLREATPTVSPISDNAITVAAQFDNVNLLNPVSFNAIGWFGKINSGQEQLMAVTPTAKTETLAAGSLDQRSSQAIAVDLEMALSNSAQVSMTVNPAGTVSRQELQTFSTAFESKVDQKIAESVNSVTASLNGGTPVHQDANHNINLETYDKKTIDSMVAGAGKGAGINTVQGVAPDSKGNVDLATVFYKKTDVDNLLQTLGQQINTLTNGNTSYTQAITDLTKRVKYLEDNAIIGRHFSDDATAAAWEASAPNHMAIVDKQS